MPPSGADPRPARNSFDELQREQAETLAELLEVMNERQWRLLADMDRAGSRNAAGESDHGQSSASTASATVKE